MDGIACVHLTDIAFRTWALIYWDVDKDGYINQEEALIARNLNNTSVNNEYGIKFDLADFRELVNASWNGTPFIGSAKKVYIGQQLRTTMSNTSIVNNSSLEYFNTEWSNLTTIGHTNFNNCIRLKEFVSGDALETVEHYVFKNCTSLVKVRLGSGLKSLQRQTFAGCSALAELYIKAEIPPEIGSIGGGTFLVNSPKCKIYVPQQSVNTYGTATNWVQYANRIYGYEF